MDRSDTKTRMLLREKGKGDEILMMFDHINLELTIYNISDNIKVFNKPLYCTNGDFERIIHKSKERGEFVRYISEEEYRDILFLYKL